MVIEIGKENVAQKYSEYVGKHCSECTQLITDNNNNNGDGLCIPCMTNAVQDHCF